MPITKKKRSVVRKQQPNLIRIVLKRDLDNEAGEEYFFDKSCGSAAELFTMFGGDPITCGIDNCIFMPLANATDQIVKRFGTDNLILRVGRSRNINVAIEMGNIGVGPRVYTESDVSCVARNRNNGTLYFSVSENGGISFWNWFKKSQTPPLTAEQVYRACIELWRAMEGMHNAGWAHNDVHLNNVLINPNTGRVLLIDFDRASSNPNVTTVNKDFLSVFNSKRIKNAFQGQENDLFYFEIFTDDELKKLLWHQARLWLKLTVDDALMAKTESL